MNDTAKGPGDELLELYPVTYTDGREGILINGKEHRLPTAGYENYLLAAERATTSESRKVLLSIAKFLADKEAEYSREVHAENQYLKNLPNTVRRLESEVQELKDQVTELTKELRTLSNQVYRW